jgi:hypothetical protein
MSCGSEKTSDPVGKWAIFAGDNILTVSVNADGTCETLGMFPVDTGVWHVDGNVVRLEWHPREPILSSTGTVLFSGTPFLDGEYYVIENDSDVITEYRRSWILFSKKSDLRIRIDRPKGSGNGEP